MEKQGVKQKAGKEILTFTVTECGEYHYLGEYHEEIKTLEEAATLYQKIPSERMNGIHLHVVGTDKLEDLQADILSGDEIDTAFLRFISEFYGNLQVWEAVKKLTELFPDKEVIGYETEKTAKQEST